MQKECMILLLSLDCQKVPLQPALRVYLGGDEGLS